MSRNRKARAEAKRNPQYVATIDDRMAFTDPFNCQMCRDAGALCNLHNSMSNNTSYKPKPETGAKFNENNEPKVRKIVCPHCKRQFPKLNLATHIKTAHPESDQSHAVPMPSTAADLDQENEAPAAESAAPEPRELKMDPNCGYCRKRGEACVRHGGERSGVYTAKKFASKKAESEAIVPESHKLEAIPKPAKDTGLAATAKLEMLAKAWLADMLWEESQINVNTETRIIKDFIEWVKQND